MQVENGITGTLRKETRGHEPVIAFGLDEEQNGHEEVMGCLKARVAGGGFEGAVAFTSRGRKGGADIEASEGVSYALRDSTGGGAQQAKIATALQVRRLTPKECERLQGFPDDHTLIPWKSKPADQCPDGPRYKALGNSMAVNVMSWIGQRIDMVDKLTHPRQTGTKGEVRL